jgi:hypothetical protein
MVPFGEPGASYQLTMSRIKQGKSEKKTAHKGEQLL